MGSNVDSGEGRVSVLLLLVRWWPQVCSVRSPPLLSPFLQTRKGPATTVQPSFSFPEDHEELALPTSAATQEQGLPVGVAPLA
jgi:hypothetical protein